MQPLIAEWFIIETAMWNWQSTHSCRWVLTHRLFADAIEELLGQAAASTGGTGQPSANVDAWMLVTDIVTEPYRDNAFGTALRLSNIEQCVKPNLGVAAEAA